MKMKKYKVLKQFRQRFIYFGRNSGIHGLNYLFRANANVFTRTFWLLAITASLICMYMILLHNADLGVNIKFTPDTRYLHWKTAFPAVTVCEERNTKQALKRFLALYPDLLSPLDYDHRRYLTDLLYANGQCSKAQCAPCGTTVPCDVPWREVINKVHKKCEDILTECFYNGQALSCCEYFRPVDSEHGTCFSFNTLQHKGRPHQSLFVVNRTTGPGVLTFRLRSDVEVSLHSPEELSTSDLELNQKELLHTYSENVVELLFSVVEIDNDPPLYKLGVDVRECRFVHELLDQPFYNYPVYSYGACLLAYSTRDSYRQCGCVHPVRDMSYKKHFCNYTGMNCWNTFEEYKSKLYVVYNCLPSCEESELKMVHFSKRWDPEGGPGILVNVKMVSLPTLRYRRALMSDNLDLVVTVGGIVGLFFSASILSLIEVFYLILRTPKSE